MAGYCSGMGGERGVKVLNKAMQCKNPFGKPKRRGGCVVCDAASRGGGCSSRGSARYSKA
jgi:hypothetical protein